MLQINRGLTRSQFQSAVAMRSSQVLTLDGLLQVSTAGRPCVRNSLACEAKLLAHGFHASLHDGAAARDLLAKLSEAGGFAH